MSLQTCVRKICGLASRVEERGRSAGGTLVSVQSDLVEDLRDAAMMLCKDYSRDKAPDLVEQLSLHEPQFWLQMLIIHSWALRDIKTLQRLSESSAWSLERKASWEKICICVCLFPRLVHASGVLFPPSEQGKRLMCAILGSDLMACYAAVFATISHVPRTKLYESLNMVSCLLMVTSQVGHVAGGRDTVDESALVAGTPVLFMPLTPALYRDWLRALSESYMMEHAVKAIFHMEASAQAALTELSCPTDVSRWRLAEMNMHLMGVINSTVEPHLNQPILSLSPRPLANTGGTANPTVRGTVRLLRRLLSGTCLQFWMGKQLLENRLMLTGGEGTTHGLHAPILLPAPLKPTSEIPPILVAPRVQQFMNACITVWQITVSGPRPPTPVISLGRALPADFWTTLSLPASMPYGAVNVYDMSYEALWCVAQRLPELERAGVVDPGAIANTLRLACRLILELQPGDTVERLPGLWRAITHLTPSMCVLSLHLSDSVYRIILTLFQMVLPEEVGLAVQPGAAAAGGADPAGCLYSLRCALEARFLPALELAFRRLATRRPPDVKECAKMAHTILRVSGVWPAILAHGSEKEVASLIATLRKVARVLLDPAATRIGPLVAGGAAGDGAAECLLALLEQTAAVVLQPWNMPAPPARAAGSNARSTNSSRRRQGGAAAGGSSSGGDGVLLAQAKRKLVEYNNSLDVLKGNNLTVDWLVQAGGQLLAGSQSAVQQRLLAVYAMVQWLPPVLSSLSPATDAGRAASKYVLMAAQQLLKLCDEVMDDGPLPPLHFQRFQSWQRFLLEQLQVMPYLARVFSLSDRALRDFPELAPAALDLLEVLTVSLQWDVAQCVVLVGDAAAAGTSARKGSAKGGGKGSGKPVAVSGRGSAPPESAAGSSAAGGRAGRVTVTLEEAFLLRYGRKSLRAALQAMQPLQREGIASAGPSVLPKLAALPQVSALLEEMVTKHDLDRLPSLPSPAEAESAVAAAGVKHCFNAHCNVMDGAPQESEVSWKRCARCKVACYCCSGCQRAHWDAGHKKECAPVSG
ncbi:hypothetical protein PLESTB_000718700 [Pleodorina starrii]|uniref:phytol kinase n=1 Tax=Pleodorina starrii TaxID=330485 RepID=A0A9W6BKE2_9CHLO|nr:hypothetical protein PLESTM_001708800 [Pleodorina starrii]GLC53197.1 hypothetical protein PLESTB_000718700 [Pleodorina starrii]GLC68652.1 hypothetical protein PLESTF_000719300 [Pleodorina starrii]